MSALDCSLPPELQLHLGSPYMPFLEAEASALIQPCQNSTWKTFRADKSKYYLYSRKRSSKASRDSVPHRPGFPPL